MYAHSQNVEGVDSREKILECEIGKWPLTYVGAQIGLSSWRKIFSNLLLKKIKNKFASWKMSSLSEAGGLSLVKSTLGSLLIN